MAAFLFFGGIESVKKPYVQLITSSKIEIHQNSHSIFDLLALICMSENMKVRLKENLVIIVVILAVSAVAILTA